MTKRKVETMIVLSGSDIGNPFKQGSTRQVAGGYDILAGGKDIWEASDQFHYAYFKLTGDFDLTARLESLSMPNLYTKAGLMARDSLEPGSPHAYLMVFADNSPRNKNNGGYEFQYRNTTEGPSAAIYPANYSSDAPKFPVRYPSVWLRLKRSGDSFESFYSDDGTIWKLYADHAMKLLCTVYLGLAVTSHNVDETAKAAFRDIALNG
jgi:regulation of enolase protein 1 (concanavalin A-like superfamily)